MRSVAAMLTVHNRRDKTIACLENLTTQRLPSGVLLDVYLVNDGCTDGTEQAVTEQYPNVNIIQGDGSLYWNRGMWTAWDVASKKKKYDYFLWLNDDTFLLENAVRQLLDLSEHHNNAAIVVGATKASVGNKLTYGGHTRTNICPCDGMAKEVYGFNGNIVLVPHAVFAVLGNLDYYYSHGKGDFDYALRARKAGIMMFQCGNVLGICDEHKHFATWCDPEVPICQRWKAMHSPTGMPPNEMFHYEKQINVWTALYHVATIYLRCAFPIFWIKRQGSIENTL